jgi:rubrerythrin
MDEITRIIQVAISNEKNAEEYYREAASIVKLESAKKVLLELAEEEKGHETFLKNLLEKGIKNILSYKHENSLKDLKIVDYLSVKELNEYSNYQDVLTVAMQREKIAYDFYNSMASLVEDEKLKSVFENLAAVEMGHKIKLEKLYEEEFYQEF